MDQFYKYDPLTAGSKGLVYVGDKILVYRRDNNTNRFPLHLDLPGGGPKGRETPYETFRREVKEEFNLNIHPNDITHVYRYESVFNDGKYGYFPIAKLSAAVKKDIKLGSEGSEYMLMTLKEFISRKDAWPLYQERAAKYAIPSER